MTLILLLPFKGGYLVLADRQNTFSDLIAESTEKIFYLSHQQAVIAGCGATDSIKRIVSMIQISTGQISVSQQVQDKYKRCCDQLLTTPMLDKKEEEALREVEFLVIETQGTSISFYHIRDGLPPSIIRKIDQRGEGWSMGSENATKLVQPQLLMAGDLRARELEKVIEFGQALIAYASLTEKTVGDPSKYGVDAILIHKQQQGFSFEERPLTAKYGMERRFKFRWQI